jgi:serine protease Do
MASNSGRLLKLAGLGAGILGAIALFVIVAPLVYGQTRPKWLHEDKPSALSEFRAQLHRVQNNPLVQWKHQILGGSSVGIDVRDVDEADVKREKLPGQGGAVVQDVRSDSPAAKAGIKAGDVIVSFDGERVRGARHFDRLVTETPAGRTVDATVMRAGAKVNLKVTVDTVDAFEPLKQYSYLFNRPDAFTMSQPRWESFSQYGLGPRGMLATGRARLGVGVQDLTEQLGEYFGTSQGALVTAVDEGTPAKSAGLKAGDVITRINGEIVRDTADLRRKLGDTSGETKITIVRDRKELTVTAKISE